MSSGSHRITLFTAMLALGGASLLAQMPNPYGAPIGLEEARKPLAAAMAEAV